MTVQEYNKTLETMEELLLVLSSKIDYMRKDLPEPNIDVENEFRNISDELFNIQSKLWDCQIFKKID